MPLSLPRFSVKHPVTTLMVMLTEKISGSLFASYEDAEYDQLIAQERDDSTFLVRPAAQYLFKEWLMAELSYQYEQRDSTDDLFDFETNTFLANVKVAF